MDAAAIQWLMGFAAVLVIFNAAVQAWKNLRGAEPHPPNSTLDYSNRELARRVGKHDEEITLIWTTMRSEHQRLQSEMNRNVKEQERTLGNIEGELKGIHEQLKVLNERQD